MMRAPVRLYRRFIASTRGVAAIEFAMILPVLLILFLGSFDAGRAIAIYMKVRSASYALAAITNQYTTIHDFGHDVDLGGDFRHSFAVSELGERPQCHRLGTDGDLERQGHGHLEQRFAVERRTDGWISPSPLRPALAASAPR